MPPKKKKPLHRDDKKMEKKDEKDSQKDKTPTWKEIAKERKKDRPYTKQNQQEDSESDSEDDEKDKKGKKPPLFEADPAYDSSPTVQERKRSGQIPSVQPYSAQMCGPDYTICCVGKRREGKSFFTRWQLYHMRGLFPQVYVFTNTKINNYWQTMVPDRYIFEGVQEGVLHALIQQQKNLISLCYEHPEWEINPRMVIIFDDVINEDMHHSPALKTLFYNGRHIHSCVFFNIQYAR